MWGVTFHEKSNLEKNCDFLKIPDFSKFVIFVKTPRNCRPPDENSREFGPPQVSKMQEYTGFPKFSSQNSDFSPKSVDLNFEFS